MKQQLIDELREKLTTLGLSTTNESSDIAIHMELLDVKWSTGKKKLQYDAFILADEADQMIYMYEKTEERSAGLSFGTGSESSFQSGSTLFRKVKSTQYGPDGKVFEYTFDLGAIPKTVKETAAQHGWKFKTVLNKKKATYTK